MALKFGTSGVRGLVTEMTDRECFLYALAFAGHLGAGGCRRPVAVGGDLRPSTPRIMAAVAAALRFAGLAVDYCGAIPSPALAAHGLARQRGSVMVTGSHIPADRNGIKFNLPTGEIAKADEEAITRRHGELRAAGAGAALFDAAGQLLQVPELGAPNPEPAEEYVQRYRRFCPPAALAGYRLVVYEHSAVGRDLLGRILRELGAEVLPVGRSDRFVPVDTEAVEDLDTLAAWVRAPHADALVSMDGDSDRPLLLAADGRMIRGDVLGILAARFLGADAVATPVSCNSALEASGWFPQVRRTRIGSPYVIEGMQQALARGCRQVVGYEANGGFLTATEFRQGADVLAPLPTRDAVLPVLAVLLLARREGRTLAQLLDSLPPRYTASGLLRETPSETGQAIVAAALAAPENFAREYFAALAGPLAGCDATDGARLSFAAGRVIHLRPSGNAPEFRCYTEAASEAAARELNERVMAIVRERLVPAFAAKGKG